MDLFKSLQIQHTKVEEALQNANDQIRQISAHSLVEQPTVNDTFKDSKLLLAKMKQEFNTIKANPRLNGADYKESFGHFESIIESLEETLRKSLKDAQKMAHESFSKRLRPTSDRLNATSSSQLKERRHESSVQTNSKYDVHRIEFIFIFVAKMYKTNKLHLKWSLKRCRTCCKWSKPKLAIPLNIQPNLVIFIFSTVFVYSWIIVIFRGFIAAIKKSTF